MSSKEITLQNIKDAHEKIKDHIRLTQLIHSDNLSNLLNSNIYLKCENLQRCKAYKFRGAMNKISRFPHGSTIVCVSAGNHSQGCALASKICGHKCIVYMPNSAPKSKVDATKSYGAEVRQYGDNFDEAKAKCESDLKTLPNSIFVHPFDDPEIIAGQGTIGLEIYSQLESAQTIVIPVGGGGLCSGIAIAIKSLNPKCRIIAVNAGITPSSYIKYQNIKNREIDELINMEDNKNKKPLADGIAVKEPGNITFKYIEKYVDEFVIVSEHEISCAICLLAERAKLIVEGAGASTIAAVMYNKFKRDKNENIVCVLSGGNIPLSKLVDCFNEGADFLQSLKK